MIIIIIIIISSSSSSMAILCIDRVDRCIGLDHI